MNKITVIFKNRKMIKKKKDEKEKALYKYMQSKMGLEKIDKFEHKQKIKCIKKGANYIEYEYIKDEKAKLEKIMNKSSKKIVRLNNEIETLKNK